MHTDTGLLCRAVGSTRTTVSRAFPVAGLTVWNSPPDELRYRRRLMMTASNYSSKQSCSVVLV